MGACASRPAPASRAGSEPKTRDSAPAGAGGDVAAAGGGGAGAAAAPEPEPERIHYPAPVAAGEAERVGLVRAIGVLDTEREGRFDSITRLLCTVFNVPIAIVSLVDEERQWFKAVEGLGACLQTDRTASFCAWTLVPEHPQLLVVEDALDDVRFKNNPLVLGEPYIRFYAGSPLVSSANGYRYGSLCVIDMAPHHDFTPEQYNLLVQFAELVVREIEKDKLAILQKLVAAGGADALGRAASGRLSAVSVSSAGSEAAAWGLTRAADCFREAVLLLDASRRAWPVAYANDAFVAAVGVSRDAATAAGFWDLFDVEEARAEVDKAVAAREPFAVAARLRPGVGGAPAAAAELTVELRPAATATLAARANLVGVPADVPPGAGGEQLFYFGIVHVGGAAGRGSGAPAAGQPLPYSAPRRSSLDGGARPSAASSARAPLSLRRPMPSAFTDVRLGPLIGRGAYGRVYRGSWNGNTVAVKVFEAAGTEPDEDGVGGVAEAVLSAELSHPNIAQTYQYATRAAEPRPDGGGGAPGRGAAGGGRQQRLEVWLVSEYCNRGPLLTAVERGAFLTQPAAQYGQPNLIAVLQTLQEVAAAMQYLHAHDVVHGDLTGGNVLLTTSDKDARGFTAKIVDFGLSRLCTDEYVRTKTLGCAEYMPPELITDGLLTRAADVYAFGIIAWEVYSGRRAWEGLKPAEVLRRVARREAPAFPPQTPHRLRVLGERCMEFDPGLRPSFCEVLSEVNSILNDTMGILQQFLAASASGAPRGGGSDAPSR